MPQIRQRRSRNGPQNFSLVVVGFKGLGKTSFLRTLVETFEYLRPDVDIVVDQALEPTLATYTINAEIKEEGERMNVTLVDTAGLDESKDLDLQCNILLRFLEAQYEARLEEESKVHRDPKAIDSLIHGCIYFIDPTSIQMTKGQGRGLHARDIKIMKRLGTRVNVIPILAKSDVLTTAQRSQMKLTIVADLIYHKINIYRFGSVDSLPLSLLPKSTLDNHQDGNEEDTIAEHPQEFDVDVFEQSKDLMNSLPFALVSKEEADVFDDSGRRIRGRRYPWGFIDVMNQSHCDFVKLRNALFQSQWRALKKHTHEFFYENFRTEKLIARRTIRSASENPEFRTRTEFENASGSLLDDISHISLVSRRSVPSGGMVG